MIKFDLPSAKAVGNSCDLQHLLPRWCFSAAGEVHLLAKILKLPVKAARHSKKTLIVLACIQLAVRNDGYLSKLLAVSGKVTIASGGFLPNFQAMLLLTKTAETGDFATQTLEDTTR